MVSYTSDLPDVLQLSMSLTAPSSGHVNIDIVTANS